MSNATSTSTRPVAQLWATRQGFGIRVYSQSDFEWLHYYIKYTHHVSQLNVLYTPTAPSYAVVYINTMRVPDTLIPGVRDRFSIINDQPKVAWAKIDFSQKLAGRIASTKSAIAKYNLNREIKPTMVKIFGSPAAVKQAFAEHNFYIKGHATLTQCLRLLELTKHLKECLDILKSSPAPSVDAPAIPKPVEPVTVPVEVLPPIQRPTALLEAASPVTVDVTPEPDEFAVLEAELTGMSLTQLRHHMKANGISGKGTRGYKAIDLVYHILDWCTNPSS